MTTGLANAHTHIYSALAPFGMPPPAVPPQNFLQILQRVWWRLDRAIDAASLRASARLYAAEALMAGTTVLIDHHESPNFIEGSLDVIAEACEETGVQAVLCYGATERNGGRDEARRGLSECARFINENRRPFVRGVIGLHASFTVSDETIAEAGRLCRDLGTVLHVHVAEDLADLDDARARGFEGPLERLLALGALPAGSILAHGVHFGPDQVRRASDAGCWIVQNPRSNRNNRVGYPGAIAASSQVALGTDGFPADMMIELRTLHEVGTEAGEHPVALDARAVGSLRLATALFDENVENPPAGGGIRDWLAQRAATARERTTLGARIVCQHGRVLTCDVTAIRDEARREAERLWTRMAALPDVN